MAPQKIRLRTRRLDSDSIPFPSFSCFITTPLFSSLLFFFVSFTSLLPFLATALAMAEWKLRKRDFISALEEERRKIQMFSRELPLCLQLVNEAIDDLQQRMTSDEISGGEKPAMDAGGTNCKLDWLRSAQLWSPGVADELPNEGGTLRKPVAVNARRVGRAFQPFERSRLTPSVADASAAPAVSSTLGERRDGVEDMEKKEEVDQSPASSHSIKKQRRCWSPDLHRKFLSALDELGGSHAATPKQIRDMMKVDGLTNDEVKSHLQKYRLHMRRPTAMVQSSSSNSTRDQLQYILLGGIWAPPHEYAATGTPTTQPIEGRSAASLQLDLGSKEEKTNKKQKMNEPTAVLLHSQQRNSQDDDSLMDDAATISNSSSSSFSSQTTSV